MAVIAITTILIKRAKLHCLEMKKQIGFKVITMDIDRFFKTVLSQNAEELRKYFQKNAVIKWHCTNEFFTLEEYIKANCEYPGNWNR